jgi:hypothetical protein
MPQKRTIGDCSSQYALLGRRGPTAAATEDDDVEDHHLGVDDEDGEGIRFIFLGFSHFIYYYFIIY